MRRRPRNRISSGSIDSTPESRYARIRTAGWLMRVLDRKIVLNSALFECASWGLSGLDFCLNALVKEVECYGLVSNNEEELGTTPANPSHDGPSFPMVSRHTKHISTQHDQGAWEAEVCLLCLPVCAGAGGLAMIRGVGRDAGDSGRQE